MSRLIIVSRDPEPDERLMICRVPIGPEEICGKLFREGEERAWQKHVGECAAAHRDEIAERSLRNRLPIFDENNWNPDVTQYLRKVGERMKAEGRLVMKPNERIHNE